MEMLVVLTILGLIAGISALSMRRATDDKQSFQNSIRDLGSALRSVRQKAITGSRQIRVIVDLDHRSVIGPNLQKAFPQNARILYRTVASEIVDGRTATLIFFSDGSTSGGAIYFEGFGTVRAIHINWLSGAVQIREDEGWPDAS